MIELNKVSKHYNRKTEVLHKLKFSIEPGRLHLIRGESGSGKTTLLNLAAGFLAPSEGEVLFEGVSFKTLHGQKHSRIYSQRIGYSYQEGGLIPYLTVMENITLPVLADRGRILKRDENRAEQLAQQLLIEDRLDVLPGTLSSGELKRVSLARAIYNEPDYLFADEPTGNLDDSNAALVASLLLDYVESGHAVVIATHNRSGVFNGREGVKIKKLELKKRPRKRELFKGTALV